MKLPKIGTNSVSAPIGFIYTFDMYSISSFLVRVSTYVIEVWLEMWAKIHLKELSHEIEMGCLWYGWKEPCLEMNL